MMLKTYICPTLCLGVGLFIGAVAGYQYAKKVYTKRVNEEMERIDKLRKMYQDKINEEPEKEEEPPAQAIPEQLQPYSMRNPDGTFKDEILQKYHDLLVEHKYDGVDPAEMESPTEDDGILNVANGPIITNTSEGSIDYPDPDKYAYAGDLYPEVSCTYYAGDMTLIEDASNEEIDINSTVGDNFDAYFDRYEEDICYVINHRLGLRYEISKEMTCWEDIYGPGV